MCATSGKPLPIVLTMSVSWAQALAFRLQRHLLQPVGDAPVAAVVRRLGAVLATDGERAELAVRLRRTSSARGDVARALAEGRIVRTFAFRGATHYLSAEDGGAYLALRASGRQWERRSWRQHYGLEPSDWPVLRDTVREALAQGPMTVDELGPAVTRRPQFRHLRPVFDGGATTLLKALSWQGDLSIGPSRADGRPTFQRLHDAPHWAGVWDVDEAGPYAIRSFLGGYGPATREHVHHWLGNGLSAGRRRLDAWLDGLHDQLAAVDVEGVTAYVLAEHVDDLLAARPAPVVRLLPGHDQWVLGPGTADERVVPPSRRAAVTRRADLVVVGGTVSGTWSAGHADLRLSWFREQGPPPRQALQEQVDRLATLLDRPLGTTLEIV